MWSHYIDNVFMIWDGPSDILLEFFHLLNENTYNLNFTLHYDWRHVLFLDVDVVVDETGKLSTSLFRKPIQAIHFYILIVPTQHSWKVTFHLDSIFASDEYVQILMISWGRPMLNGNV